jgi:hypothetical protein
MPIYNLSFTFGERPVSEPMTEACEAAVDAASLPVRKRHLPLDRERREITDGNDIFGRRP